ncbi:MAG: hypothetical protein ABIJ08_02555 [Nanoarchaeota archaeon]
MDFTSEKARRLVVDGYEAIEGHSLSEEFSRTIDSIIEGNRAKKGTDRNDHGYLQYLIVIKRYMN